MDQAKKAFELMNHFGSKRLPFLFVIDFECRKPVVLPLEEAVGEGIFFDFRGQTNAGPSFSAPADSLIFEKYPILFSDYLKAFEPVMAGLQSGNSYLLNLTFPTPVKINRTLSEIFFLSRAPYKLLFRDAFTVFSPECFVRINNGIISSFPMKGTINAGMPGADRLLLEDAKEIAEHHTIVDLIRNDLSMVAEAVKVKRFRYLEEIQTNHRHLLQASSEITGRLPVDWVSQVGNILKTLLPAGSISGAPKKKTLEIIRRAEPDERGYYTGICGIFDGHGLDSAVMIRFIENSPGGKLFRSGGGITINSNPESEYRELIDKVYVPFV
jgi:para-aminobenzoate synthetase component 1